MEGARENSEWLSVHFEIGAVGLHPSYDSVPCLGGDRGHDTIATIVRDKPNSRRVKGAQIGRMSRGGGAGGVYWQFVPLTLTESLHPTFSLHNHTFLGT